MGRAFSGVPQLVLVGGEAGVGKTRLVEEFAARAETGGALVLTGACLDLSQAGLPLVPVAGAVRELVRRIGLDELLGLLPAAATLGQLLPELREASHTSAPHSVAGLLPSLVALLERVSGRQPVVLIIEDLHWADQSTRDLLTLLARGCLAGARVLTIVTYRADALRQGDALRAYLAELTRVRGVDRIELTGLSRAETDELAAGMLGQPPGRSVTDHFHQRSGGNPLFITELVGAGCAADHPMPCLPSSPHRHPLRNLLFSRVDQLNEGAHEVIRAAAVGGQRVPHRLLAAAAGLEEEPLLAALRTAVDSHVLVAEGDGYAFRHGLTREVVYDDMLPGERLRLHRRYAEILADQPDLVTPGRAAAEIAYHWYQASEKALALPALLAAAQSAAELGAYAEEHQMLLRALSLWPAVSDTDLDLAEVLERAVVAAWRTGHLEQALDLVDRAIAAVDPDGDPERAVRLLAHRGRLLLDLGRDGAFDPLERAERLLPAGSSAAGAMVLATLAAALERKGHFAEAAARAQQAARIADEVGDPTLRVSASATLGLALARLDRHAEALTELKSAQALAEQRHDLPGMVRIQLDLAYVLWEAGRYEQVIDTAAANQPALRQAGLHRTHGSHLGAFGVAAMLALGQWDDADVELARILDDDPVEVYAIHPHLLAGELAAARGDLTTAKRELATAQTLSRRYGVPQGDLLAARLTAEIALAERRIADAWRAVADWLRPGEHSGQTALKWALLATAAVVETHRRASARAYLTAPAHADLTQAIRDAAAGLSTATPLWCAYAMQVTAELDTLDRAPGGWPRVVAAWDQLGAVPAAAYARLRAAEAAAAAGDRRGAQDLLAAAAEQAAGLGARPLQRDIELLTRRLGADLIRQRPERVRTTPVDKLKLTRRETDVLRLLTTGASNRRIATELFITEKTASVHVSRILAKLGAGNRGEAAAIAHKLRLFDEAGQL